MSPCAHPNVECLNEYEFIRKYRCAACLGVAMCRCDEDIALRFLPHQIHEGTELLTQTRVPVTLGFEGTICRACRGLPLVAHPVAAIHGRTTKIRRYYWREIEFEKLRRFADRTAGRTLSDNERTEMRREIEAAVVREMQALHETSPKYDTREESQSDVLRRYEVAVESLHAEFVRQPAGQHLGIVVDGKIESPEEFVAAHFRRQGYQALLLESRPLHVLYGVFSWLLVQDPRDPRVRPVGFGSRTGADEGGPGREIWTLLPDDFGSSGYALRRQRVLDAHFEFLERRRDELEALFDLWLAPSADFREYLWAHRADDVLRARAVLRMLPAIVTLRLLRYVASSYWDRYTGWPDLLLHRGEEICFVEVKASGDSLSDSQKRWIRDNATDLHLPFKLVKIHRLASAAGKRR